MFSDIVMIDYSRPLAERLKARKTCGPYRWTGTQAGKGRGFYMGRNGQCDRMGSTFRLRITAVGPTRRGVTGYWADEEGFTVMHPIVAALRHGRGWLAGWTLGGGMCASLDGYVWDNEQDAAGAAHDAAERAAEAEREYQAQNTEDGEG